MGHGEGAGEAGGGEEGGLELGPGCSPGTRQQLPVSDAHMMILGAWAKVGKLGVLQGRGWLALSGAHVPCPVCVRGPLRQGVGPSQAGFGAPWSHLERWGGGQSRARAPGGKRTWATFCFSSAVALVIGMSKSVTQGFLR